MMRWKVRKSPTGDWWAHEPTCNRRGDIVCWLFSDCQNCTKFRTAYAYAEHKTATDWRNHKPPFAVNLFGHNGVRIRDELTSPLYKRAF